MSNNIAGLNASLSCRPAVRHAVHPHAFALKGIIRHNAERYLKAHLTHSALLRRCEVRTRAGIHCLHNAFYGAYYARLAGVIDFVRIV